jgi:hypothetical protein
MTILATHFSLVLGAWRVRVRFDIDEPRETELDESPVLPHGAKERIPATTRDVASFAPWGRG